ncbi:MAG: branched-chain amino acid transport system permease protein [Micromonosporaceae bacterium]
MTATISPARTSAHAAVRGGWAGRLRRVLPVATVLAVAVAPFGVTPPVSSALTRMCAFAVLVVGLDLLTGVAGLPSLGQAAPFGAGAYAAAIVATRLSPVAPLQLVAGAAAGGLLAAVIGWLAVRLRGINFLMITLALAELVHALANQWSSLTGGSNGLVGLPFIRIAPAGPPLVATGYVLWYVLAVSAACVAVVVVVSRSAFGRTLRGIRDNEGRMRALGYATFWPKYLVFCIAGVLAGVGGSLWVAQAQFVSPGSLNFEVSALALMAVVIGGRGTLYGPVLGAALVVLVRYELSPYLAGRGMLLLGGVFILVVYLLPKGLAGGRARRSA